MKQYLTLFGFLWLFTQLVFAQQLVPVDQRLYGNQEEDDLMEIIASQNGGKIMLIKSDSWGADRTEHFGDFDYWVVKLDDQNNVVWERSFGGNEEEWPIGIVELSNGDIFVGGHSQSGVSGNKTTANYGFEDCWLVKLDESGNKIWDKSFGSDAPDGIVRMLMKQDTLLLLCNSFGGQSGTKTLPGYGSSDIWLIATDTAGNELFQRAYGGDTMDFVMSARLYEDTVYIIGSSVSGISGNKTVPNYGDRDSWVFKLDSNYDPINQVDFGGTEEDGFQEMIVTDNDNFLFVGGSYSDVGGNKTSPGYGLQDAWIMKTDKQFNRLNEWSFGGTKQSVLLDLVKRQNGNYLALGWSEDTITPWQIRPSQGYADLYLVELDAQGEFMQSTTWGGEDTDYGMRVFELPNNQLQVYGNSMSSNSGDITIASHSPGFPGYYNDVYWCTLASQLSVTVSEQLDWKCYPNPFSSTLTIEQTYFSEEEYFVLDVTGKYIHTFVVSGTKAEVQLETLPAGIYYLKNEQGEQLRMVKL